MDTSHSNNLNNNQTMKLPIPKTQSSSVLSSSSTINSIMLSNAKQSSQEMLITTSWQPNNNLASTGTTLSLTASSLPVIPCQTLGGVSPIGKPVPNKRGRKPLQTMPSTKKHIQNLTNQRAFRQRRENYIRTLETKANTFEILYTQAQEEIKSLKEQNELLKKQLQTEGSRNNVCGDGIMESIEPQHQQQHCASKKLCNNSCSNKATSSYCGIGGGISVDGSFYNGQTIVEDHRHEEIPKNCRGNDIVMSDAPALSPSSCCSDGSINMTTSTSQSSASNSIYVSASTNHFQPQCLSPTSPPDKFASLSASNPAGVVNVLSPPYHQNLATAVTTYTFNEQQHRHQQQSPPQAQRQHLDLQRMRPQPQSESVQQSCSPSPSRQISASDIINESVFCETKNGDLCYCEPEPVSGSSHNIEDPIKAEFQAMGSQPIINEKTGKKMWILQSNPTPTCETMQPYFPMQQQQASNRCSQIPLSQGSPSNGDGCLPVPALPSPEESESQHWQLQSGFYSQAPAAASTATGAYHHSSLHHPQQHQNANSFDYKWIVSNVHREEQCA